MAQLRDQSGTVVFAGTVEGAGPPAGARAKYDIGNSGGAFSDFVWSLASGAPLLDLSDAAHPTPVASAIYAITVSVAASGVVGATPVFGALLVMGGVDAIERIPGLAGEVSLALTYYCPAGSLILVADASTSDVVPTFNGRATVQRLS